MKTLAGSELLRPDLRHIDAGIRCDGRTNRRGSRTVDGISTIGFIGAGSIAPTAGKIVMDANNYYAHRDGTMAALDDGLVTTSGLLQQKLPDARVVKVFNHIQARHLLVHATPSGSPRRRALAMFGDDAEARSTVAALLDDIGYDTVDGGTLAQSWRIEPDQPGYGPHSDRSTMTRHLANARPLRP